MLSDEVKNVDYASFLRQRITELRMKRNVSEYQMSLELGQQFFSGSCRPELIDAISEGIQELSEADLELLLLFIRRLQKNI